MRKGMRCCVEVRLDGNERGYAVAAAMPNANAQRTQRALERAAAMQACSVHRAGRAAHSNRDTHDGIANFVSFMFYHITAARSDPFTPCKLCVPELAARRRDP